MKAFIHAAILARVNKRSNLYGFIGTVPVASVIRLIFSAQARGSYVLKVVATSEYHRFLA